ncbi:hypothetical protein MRB53_040440 [Persea americana]|nr:hypothetical protein MRB53_040440 [Persea americana]
MHAQKCKVKVYSIIISTDPDLSILAFKRWHHRYSILLGVMPRNVLSSMNAANSSISFTYSCRYAGIVAYQTQGNIGTWQKQAGDSIAPGDVLVEIETDKAQMDFEFQEEGYIAKLLKTKTTSSAFAEFSIDDAGGAKAPKSEGEATEPKNEVPQEKQEKSTESTPPAAAKQEQPKAETKSEPEPASKTSDRIFASPVARRMAEEKGIALRDIKGTGPDGRIVKVDVENYKPSKAPAKTAAPADKPAKVSETAASSSSAYTDIPLTGMRKTIAARLTESFQQSPHYYLTVSINMDKLMKLRQALNEKAEGRYKLSLNDFIVKASAQALVLCPEVNSAWHGDFIRQHHNADISVAVATPNGLMTPIITSAQARGLSSISNTTKQLAAKARDGKLKPNEYQGGTFTISNLGMYGIDNFTAIINPPSACILAIGATSEVLVLDETTERGFKQSQIMKATLSSDHRVVDGAVGAKWMKEFKQIMENPLE